MPLTRAACRTATSLLIGPFTTLQWQRSYAAQNNHGSVGPRTGRAGCHFGWRQYGRVFVRSGQTTGRHASRLSLHPSWLDCPWWSAMSEGRILRQPCQTTVNGWCFPRQQVRIRGLLFSITTVNTCRKQVRRIQE